LFLRKTYFGFSVLWIAVIMSASFTIAAQATNIEAVKTEDSGTLPLVAVHVSEYTKAVWLNESIAVVADSEWDIHGGPDADLNYVATQTLDGDPDTQWLTDNDKYDSSGLPLAGPINITYAFPVVQEINAVGMTQTSWTGDEYKSKDYEIWISPDGTSWIKVANNTLPNTDLAYQATTFAATNATKVRITITSVYENQKSHAGGLTEFKAVTTDGKTLPSEYGTIYQPILECFSLYTNYCDDPNRTMSQAIDFAYSMEGLVNIYSHFRSGNDKRRAFYIEYSKTKDDVWFTSSEEIYNWWTRRNMTNITPTYELGVPKKIKVTVSGFADVGPFALNVKIPWTYQTLH